MRVLSNREHVLHRPEMYVGALAPETLVGPCCVVDAEGSLSLVDCVEDISPGLLKVLDEILVNAADRRVTAGLTVPCTTVRVDIEGVMIRVWNDGDGIEVRTHSELTDTYVPELIFGRVMTSTNFDDSQRRVSGGRNGYGAKLANIFSRCFVVETVDAVRKRLYRQVFRNNLSEIEPPTIEVCRRKPYTCIEFWPDLARFGIPEDAEQFPEALLGVMRRRVYDIACTAPASAKKVYLNGQLVRVDGIPRYISALVGEDAKRRSAYEEVNDRWRVGACFTGDLGMPGCSISFVNSISTVRGGTHVDLVFQQVVAAVQAAVKAKAGGSSPTPTMVREAMLLMVDCLVENPSFDGQKKEELKTRPRDFGSACKLSDRFLERVVTKTGIVPHLVAVLAGKEQANLMKQSDGRRVTRLRGIPKLNDAEHAGTAQHSRQCTLILTEGDSANASAVAGLSELPLDRRRYYGTFPLRGKPLNAREASVAQLERNQEITHLKKILGLQQHRVYDENDNSLRYGRVLIYTDADVDGSHIKGLLMNFFGYFWPSLLRRGFVCTLPTPIIKAFRGSGTVVDFYHQAEYEAWRAATAPQTGWRIKYYKGLGTSNREESRAYFRSMPDRMVDYHDDDGQAEEALRLAFEKERSDQRKQWLLAHDPAAVIDPSCRRVSFSEFVHRDLILFSKEDLCRSIPSVVDGLKPAQRKIIFVCFDRGLDQNEMKVAQLAGAVSERACYHHGEASLNQTIVRLAQDYVGASNMNLLLPVGQFGTRLLGGKDAGASRYIWTRLSPVASLLFRKEDSGVLAHVEDDGQVVEPAHYLPVLPLVLINGAEGIGTGWSCSVPPHNPKDIIENVRRLIRGEPLEPMTPWWRGFRGRVVPGKDPTKWEVQGVWERTGATGLRITELPIGTWTTVYKEKVLEPLVERKVLDRYTDNGSDTTVDLQLHFNDAAFFDEEGVWQQQLHLTTGVSTSNMHLFPPRGGAIKRYDTVGDILRDFYEERLRGYEERKNVLLESLERERDLLAWKVRFLTDKLDGRIDLEHIDSEALIQELVRLGYPAIDGGYKYITTMNLLMLTVDHRARLQKQYEEKRNEWQELRGTSACTLWERDLERF